MNRFYWFQIHNYARNFTPVRAKRKKKTKNTSSLITNSVYVKALHNDVSLDATPSYRGLRDTGIPTRIRIDIYHVMSYSRQWQKRRRDARHDILSIFFVVPRGFAFSRPMDYFSNELSNGKKLIQGSSKPCREIGITWTFYQGSLGTTCCKENRTTVIYPA